MGCTRFEMLAVLLDIAVICGPTRPLLFSTHIAFFFRSTQREPAIVEVMVEGGTWRRPGPSLRA